MRGRSYLSTVFSCSSCCLQRTSAHCGTLQSLAHSCRTGHCGHCYSLHPSPATTASVQYSQPQHRLHPGSSLDRHSRLLHHSPTATARSTSAPVTATSDIPVVVMWSHRIIKWKWNKSASARDLFFHYWTYLFLRILAQRRKFITLPAFLTTVSSLQSTGEEGMGFFLSFSCLERTFL